MSFLEDILTKLAGKNVGFISADSGFYDKGILDYLETCRLKPIDYIIAAKFYPPIKRALVYQ